MTRFSTRILKWYAHHARDLPWRGHLDPYAVWVSEIMLQQTRVESVIPYFNRWMKSFPTIQDLADATGQDVLLAWEGLGYYSRARNIHTTAKMVVEDYGGYLPDDLNELRKLPGIGKYTAGAIASIAYGKQVAVLDGNIKRVFSRFFNIDLPVNSVAGEKILWQLAERNLPPDSAGDYNQGLMDLGATICLPRNPICPSCPLWKTCSARVLGVQDQRPMMKLKPNTPHYQVTAAIITRGRKILLAERPSKGLLGGLWEFPGGKVERGESLKFCLKREIREELGVEIKVGEQVGIYHHAYSHFRITLYAFLCKLIHGEPRPIEAACLEWVTSSELSKYPMGKVDRQIAGQLK